MATKKKPSSKPKPLNAAKKLDPVVAREEILRRLADGESLNAICKTAGFPSEAAVRGWALDNVDGFGPKYARAREIGYERLSEEILAIADTPVIGVKTKINDKGETETTEGDMIEHRRLQVDTRKWMLSKMLPKRFGDKLQTEHSGELSLKKSAADLSDEELAAVIAGKNDKSAGHG